MSDVIYLALPYSHPDPKVRQFRYEQACITAYELMQQGRKVVCPVIHNHPLVLLGLKFGWYTWEGYDRLFMDICGEMIVLRLEGWKESEGVDGEIEYMKMSEKPVAYL